MYKKISYIISFIYTLVFFGLLSAECGNFSIQEDFFADHLIGFYLNSIDINTGDSSIEYFKYRIINEDSNTTNKLKIDYKLSINSSDLSLYGSEILSGSINVSDMSVPELIFSNTDINYESTGVPGANFELDGSPGDHIQLSNDELISIQQQILQSGKLPNGTYVFSVTLRCAENDNIIYDSIVKTIEAFEPVYLDLISPGGYIQDTVSTAILNTSPLFSWSSDYCTQCDYGIRVCEYNTSLHSSLYDAINDNSVLPANQLLDFFDIPSIQSFSYPSDNAFDLIPGNLYVWQIRRSYQTTQGITFNESPIFVFKITSFDNLSNESSISAGPHSDKLKQLLGFQYDQLFSNDGLLKGYAVKGSTIILDNQIVPISILNDIIDQLNNNELEIIGIEVE
ncbi:hypothetical protein N9597_03255 [Candidatus Marinimicrobia bacterium]|nr:hypothetical protein [Candidatus Neomarinimicrobiota bacterium]